MRADRLIQLLLLLQSRPRVTAREVADALEVSAARDTALRGAVRKLVQALPETFRADAELLTSAVLSDDAAWGRVEPADPGILAELRTFLARRRRIEVRYTDSRGTASVRTVDPWGLVDKAGTWYLVVAPAVSSERRVLRVDRIEDARAVGQRSEPPDGFDLEQEWQRFVAHTERLRGTVSARVLIVDSAVGPFVGLLGRNVELHDEVTVPGRRTATVTSTSEEMLARQVAGWSGLVEVLDPPGVRAELVRMGADLVAIHGQQ